ncbi:MAG: GNAT family N-acetyltransferase [Alphaproteobacteria bacterium]
MNAPIRRATPGDEHILSLIGAATFLETYAGVLDVADINAHCVVKHAPSFYGEQLADPAWRLWLAEAELGQAPVGFVTLGPPLSPGPQPSPNDIEIHRLYVLERFKLQKLGAKLLQTVTASAQEMGKRRLIVGVNALNKGGLSFYETSGFTRLGTRKFTIGATMHDDVVLAQTL